MKMALVVVACCFLICSASSHSAQVQCAAQGQCTVRSTMLQAKTTRRSVNALESQAETPETDLCPGNTFSDPSGTYSAKFKKKFAGVITSTQLESVLTHPKWKVGEMWTLSLLVTSNDEEDRDFSMSGGGGFLAFTVPAKAEGKRIKVMDTVKQESATKLIYRGDGYCGDVKLADIYFSPGNEQMCCFLNVSIEGTYSAKNYRKYADVVHRSQLSSVYDHPKWQVGETWTLSVVASSNNGQPRDFAMSGGGGFLRFTVPAHAKGLFITVTDTVKADGVRRFQYRGPGYSSGDVNISNIVFTPRYSGACCGLNVFFDPNRLSSSAQDRLSYSAQDKKKYAGVIASWRLESVLTNPKWKVGEMWTLSLLVTSKDDKDRDFSMSGGGGFLAFTVPAGAERQRITVTDTVKQESATKLIYRGNGKCGAVSFTEIVFIPGPLPDCLK